MASRKFVGLFALGICILCLSDSRTIAQFGAGLRYQSLVPGYWTLLFDDEPRVEYSRNNLAFSGYYWFRLKNHRIEFLPEIGYMKNLSGTGNAIDIYEQGYFFRWNVNLYFLDLDNDCKCPTFSKQSRVLERGLFIEVTPGIMYSSLKMEHRLQPEATVYNQTEWLPTIQAGLGFDLGISDMLTVTPTIHLTWASASTWAGVDDYFDINAQINNDRQHTHRYFGAGLRVLFRPDYVSGRRR